MNRTGERWWVRNAADLTQRWSALRLLGNTLGGEFYQSFQAITSYLWRVLR